MGSLSVWHWALVALAFLLLFGTRRIPDVARGLGQSIRIVKADLSAARPDEDHVAPSAQSKPSTAE